MAPLKSRAPPTSDTRSAAYLRKSRPRCAEGALPGSIARVSLARPKAAAAFARRGTRDAACFSKRAWVAATEVMRVGIAIIHTLRRRRRSVGRFARAVIVLPGWNARQAYNAAC